MKAGCLLLVGLFLGAVPKVQAAPITVDYLGNIIEGQPGVDQGLPFFLSGDPNNLRLKFFVPDFASLVSIGSIDVKVNLYDDDDRSNNEDGTIAFVLNGIDLPNLTLQSFAGLNGTTSPSPASIMGSVAAGDLADALLEIQGDGIFFVRVNRDSGDFFVKDGTVTIDGELSAVPEPASLSLLATAVGALAIARRRRMVGKADC